MRELNGGIKTNFLGDEVPKEIEHYTCIPCITIDSVMRMEKKNYPQVYLEECKCRMKKTKITKFIEAELKSKLESKAGSDFADSEQVKTSGYFNDFERVGHGYFSEILLNPAQIFSCVILECIF